ncbi:MAG TPA: helix-turn-helix transcriptional regulator [Desulfosporosinus sp.]
MNEKSQAIYGGRKMRDARLNAGIRSQKELADRTGIAPNIISDLERGQRSMSPNWARRIAEAIGDYLIEVVE